MGKSILITGGARSGKSLIAETWAAKLGPAPIYIATAEAHDDEMSRRIATHQARRGKTWQTLATPIELTSALATSDGAEPRLVDCLTLWLSNLMHAELDWEAETRTLTQTIQRQIAPVIFVSNEVGSGIVPENALARQFRDAAGAMNQTIAEAVDDVYLAVAGYPLQVKPNAHI